MAKPNDGSGVFLYDLANDGTSVVGNTIAGNGIHGIQVEDVTGGAFIRTNNIGVGADGSTALGNTANGIDILNSQAIYAQENLIANNIEGVNINASSNNTFDANTIGANAENGIVLTGASDDNTIEYNYIGLMPDGSDFSNGTSGSGFSGIHVGGGTGNSIETNLIGGENQDYGILADGGSGTEITQNTFGKVDPVAGTEHSPTINALYVNGTNVNTVSGNVFSHDGKDAVIVNNGTVTNSITGNYFGVDDDGQTPISGVPSSAIILEGGSNTITVENNVIPETSSDAVIVRGVTSTDNTITNNSIGVFSDGTSAGPISGNGVSIQDAEDFTVSTNTIRNATNGISVDNVTGGTNSITSNTIIENTTGIELVNNSTGVTIASNFIGTNAAGSTTDLGNDVGISIASGSNGNEVSTNTIAYNTNNGVLVDGASTTGNLVSQNSMYCNQGSNSAIGTGITNTAGGNNQSTDLFSSSFASFPPFIFSNAGNYSLEVRNDSLDAYGIATDLTTGNYTLEVFSIDTKCDNCQGENYEGTMTFNASAGLNGGFVNSGVDPNLTYVVTIIDNSNNTSFFSACSKTAPCTAPDSLILSDLLSGNTDTTEICLDLTNPEFDLLADPYVGGAVDGNPTNNFRFSWYVDGAEEANTNRVDSTVDYTTAPQEVYYKVRSYSLTDDVSQPDKFKDVLGCYVEDSILVIVHELPEFTLAADKDICFKESAPLTVTLTQGASPFEFEWQDDQGFGPATITDVMDDTTWSVTPTVTNTSYIYSLASLTDNNGCMATATELAGEMATIKVNPLPSATISNITDDEICYNASTDLTIDFTGSAPFTLGYYASTSDTFTVSSPTNQLNPFNTGNLTQDTTYYLFYVKDDNKCIDTITTEKQLVIVHPEVTGTISGTDTICAGATDSLIIAFTGTAPFNFVYSLNTVNELPKNEPTDTALIFNQYPTQGVFTYDLVSVTDQFNCSATTLDGPAVKTVNALPTPSIDGELAPCFNTDQNYAVAPPIISGNTFVWEIDNSIGTGDASFVSGKSTGQDVDLDLLATGDFLLRLIEYVGDPIANPTTCRDTAEINISVIDTINFGFTLEEVCNEVDDYQFNATNVTLSPAATWKGTPYTSNNIKYIRNGTDVTSGINPSSLPSGTYEIISTQTLNATDGVCVSTQKADLIINETPQNVTISPQDTLICESATVTLDGSADLTTGTITDTYTGTGVSGNVFDANTAGVGATNTVWYIATSNKGCKDSIFTTVKTTPPLAPKFTAAQADPVCEDVDQTFIATKNNNNFGTNPVYEWRIGSPSIPVPDATGSPADFKVNSGNIVYLTVFPGADAPSCLSKQDTTIKINAVTIKRPDITDVSVIPFTKTKYCVGSSIDLASNVTPSTINDLSTEYDWIKVNQNNGDTTVLLSGSTQTNITDVGNEQGSFNYTVYVTNIKGIGSCSSSLASSSIQVVKPEIVAYAGNVQGQLVTENAFALQNETIYLDSNHPSEDINYGNYEWTLVNVENRIVNEYVDDKKSTTNIPQVMEEDKHVLYQVTSERTDVDPGCVASDTVSVRLRATCFVPNGFTPNQDGQNDTWNIECLNDGDYPNAIVKIFNRWGELIYKDEQGYKVPWDGTRNGNLVPIGTYYFAIDLNDGYGEIAGAVGIIR